LLDEMREANDLLDEVVAARPEDTRVVPLARMVKQLYGVLELTALLRKGGDPSLDGFAELIQLNGLSRGNSLDAANAMSALIRAWELSVAAKPQDLSQLVPANDTSRGVNPADTDGQGPAARMVRESADESASDADLVALSVYLESEPAHREIRAAVEQYLAIVGLEVVEDNDPVIGSWWWTAKAKRRVGDALETVPDLAVASAWGPNRTRQAANNLTDSQAAANLLHALVTSQVPGVIQVGSLLAAYDGQRSMVISLSPAQVNELERRPALLREPESILEYLEANADDNAPALGQKAITP
jgi:hypothetical protein